MERPGKIQRQSPSEKRHHSPDKEQLGSPRSSTTKLNTSIDYNLEPEKKHSSSHSKKSSSQKSGSSSRSSHSHSHSSHKSSSGDSERKSSHHHHSSHSKKKHSSNDKSDSVDGLLKFDPDKDYKHIENQDNKKEKTEKKDDKTVERNNSSRQLTPGLKKKKKAFESREGYLVKKNPKGKMQKRWIQLDPVVGFSYFKVKGDHSPAGVLDLLGATEVFETKDKECEFGFCLKVDSGRMFVFDCGSPNERSGWISDLKQVIEDKKSGKIKKAVQVEGFLLKKSPAMFKGWQRRWCIYDSASEEIRYFKAKEDISPAGSINLKNFRAEESTVGEIGIQLAGESRVYNFDCDTEEDRKKWLAALWA